MGAMPSTPIFRRRFMLLANEDCSLRLSPPLSPSTLITLPCGYDMESDEEDFESQMQVTRQRCGTLIHTWNVGESSNVCGSGTW